MEEKAVQILGAYQFKCNPLAPALKTATYALISTSAIMLFGFPLLYTIPAIFFGITLGNLYYAPVNYLVKAISDHTVNRYYEMNPFYHQMEKLDTRNKASSGYLRRKEAEREAKKLIPLIRDMNINLLDILLGKEVEVRIQNSDFGSFEGSESMEYKITKRTVSFVQNRVPGDFEIWKNAVDNAKKI